MGRPKLLLPFRGKLLLEWVLELVEGLPLERRLIVLGAHAPEILSQIFDATLPTHHSFPVTPHPLPVARYGSSRQASRVTRHGLIWEVLINTDWEEGMGSSLRLAAGHVERGMLVFLGDMPLVPQEAALAVLSRAGECPVAPLYRGQRGFPVYLPAGLRPRLLELRGDIGARGIISGDCELISVDDPGVILDIDDKASLAAAEGRPWGTATRPI